MADTSVVRDSVAIRSCDGVGLHVRRWKPSTTRPGTVLLLHGAAEHGGRYPLLVQRLTDNGYVTVAPDQRGHGRSQGHRANVDRFDRLLDDIDTIVDAVAAPPVYLIGYSMGGLVATEYALRRPARVSGVIVGAPGFGIGTGIPWPALLATRALARISPGVGLVRMKPQAMCADPAVAAAYLADPDVYHGRVRAGLVGAATDRMRDLPIRIRRLTTPLLVLHGGNDKHASVAASRAIVAAAGSADTNLIEYPAARHDLFNEPAPTGSAVADAVIEWLKKHQ